MKAYSNTPPSVKRNLHEDGEEVNYSKVSKVLSGTVSVSRMSQLAPSR